MRERRVEWGGLTQCQVVYLHGYAGEYENGMIFSRDEYASELNKKEGWYERLGEDYSNNILLAVGTSLNEPILDYHINTFAHTYAERGHSYIVTPDRPTPIRAKALSGLGFHHIQGTLSDLVRALMTQFPNGLRPKDVPTAVPDVPVEDLSSEDIEGLRSLFPMSRGDIQKRQTWKHADTSALGRKFFDGYGPELVTVAKHIPATLSQDEALSRDIWQALSAGAQGVCLIGEAGSGKNTFAVSCLQDVSEPDSKPVYYYSEQTSSLKSPIGDQEIPRL